MNFVESKLIPDFHSRRQSLLNLHQRRLDALRNRDGVRAALLAHAHALRRLAVDARDAAHVFESVFDDGDVAQVNRRSLDVLDHQAAELFEIEGLAEDAHVHFAARSLQAAGRQFDVLALNRGEHFARGDAALIELVGIDPDADVAIDRADLNLADAGHGLQPFLHAVAREVGEHLRRVRAGQADPHDRLVFGIGFGDDGRLDVARQTALDLGDAGLHVLQREVDVAREVELDGDVAAALPGVGGDVADPLDLHQRFFDRLDDVVLDDFRRGAFPGRAHADRREVDVRELGDADARRGHAAEDDRGQHEHPCEDGVLDAGFGDFHGSLRSRLRGFGVSGFRGFRVTAPLTA